MNVEVLFFARLRELTGTGSARLELPARSQVADAMEKLVELYPQLSESLGCCRIALNEEFASSEAELSADAVLAVIPPVSGG